MSARRSLILSLNMPAVSLVESMGQPRFYRSLRDLGFSTLRRGQERMGWVWYWGMEVCDCSIWRMRMRVWRRRRTPACALERMSGGGGKAAVSEGAAWRLSDILSGDERALDAVGHMADVRLPQVAWKTGTSSGFRVSWTVA
ncbi:MAG: hypothetical protein M9935_06390 [Kiritimatiellae bacterium]|nr:hypothetical protein [Kiritimatiellia bacterium]